MSYELASLERAVSHLDDKLIGISRAVRASRKDPPIDTLVKALVVAFLSHGRLDTDIGKVAQARYPDQAAKLLGLMRDFPAWVEKATTNPAQTTIPGWAAELVGSANFDGLLTMLAPQSVYAQLAARGVKVSFDGKGLIKFPKRADTPDISGVFIPEGEGIPIKRLGFQSSAMAPFSAKVISLFSADLGKRSTPSIEAVIKAGITEDTQDAIDTLLLSETAGTPSAPSGLRNGVTPITATAGGGASAVASDFGNLAAAIPRVQDLVFLANEATRLRALALLPGLTAFNFITAPLFEDNAVMAIDGADFASGEGDNPLFDVTSQAVVVNDDAEPVDQFGSMATTSLWQQDLIGIRMILDISWCLRRSGRVATVTGVSW